MLVGPASCTPDPDSTPVSAEIGAPLPGLTEEELARFQEGREVFAKPFSAEEGLGPRFNENACNACHTDPADGGTGEQLVVKASRVDAIGRCDPLTAEGGENIRRRVTDLALASGNTPAPGPDGTHRGRINTPFLFGMGMIDAIPLEEMARRADPDDEDGDGISGRLGTDASGRPARFGRKANVTTLAAFADEAFRLEMGLTTPGHPSEETAGGFPPLVGETDPAADPEIDRLSLERVLDFLRFLAPPAPAAENANAGEIARGRTLFTQLGCSGCHVPELPTAADAHPAFAGRTIALYSDLLLHDMGEGLAGHCTPGAHPSEFRTEPLMGLRHRSVFLHDGRAGRIRDAVLLHGGEAAAAQAAFAALDRVQQEALLAFLRTL